MPTTNQPQTKNHAADKGTTFAWRYSVLTVLCGTLLVAGFFLAAKQHFSSMDYGMKNSRLRKELDELEAEKRRLLLAREIALSPVELMKAARRIGFTQTGADSGEVVRASLETKIAAANSQGSKNQMVVKTVLTKPTQPAKLETAPKSPKPERQAKKETVSRHKKG